MLNKVLLGILAFGCLALVIYLGVLSSENNAYVVWFGLASAILAPLGLTLFTIVFKKDNDKLLEELSKVSEIKELINEAKTQEDKIVALEKERESLEDAIKFEISRGVLIEKKKSLENQALELLKELDSIDGDLSKIDKDIVESIDKEIIDKLRERVKLREQEDLIKIVLFDKEIVIDVEKIRRIPYFGEFAIAYIKFYSDLSKLVDNLFKK